ncbi:anaphase-promoting complex subunit 5 [Achlya hypogyna]|uniref:Anaphase-promoting complex subunit 5 n=1 Tax=Achlya hypogyna TaxID=1202772 RepID=A0A1V9YMU6_ACHHY|nr:anaphase-promoting complex subunit 5 [Achlya hypogyna]
MLAELSAPNVCVGYLIAQYVAEFHAQEPGLFVSADASMDCRQHELAALLLERVTALETPWPYTTLSRAVGAIDEGYAARLHETMASLCAGTIDDIDDLFAEHFERSSGLDSVTPLGRFMRMLGHACSTAFFDRLCRFQLELQVYMTSNATQAPEAGELDDLIVALEAGRVEHSCKQIEDHLAAQLETAPHCPRLHFARFLNFKLHREYLGALHALHAYHDYALMALDDATFGPQYATLNLVGLYAAFGYREEALSALHETLRVAQNKRDGVCIAYALAWDMQLFPEAPERARQCVDRAGDLGVTALQVLAALLAATHRDAIEAFETPLPRPLSVWLRLRQAATTLEAAASAANRPPAKPSLGSKDERPAQATTWTTAEKDDVLRRWVSLRGAVALTTAGVWHELGHRTLEHLHVQLYGLCYATKSSDVALAMRRIALLQIDPCAASRPTAKNSTESLYAAALRWLVDTADVMHVGHEPLYRETVLRVLFEWHVARGEWRRAEQSQQLLAELTRRTPGTRTEVQLLQVRLWLEQQDRGFDAVRALQALLPIAKATPLLHAQVLLLLAQAHATSAPDAPFDALPPLLECLALCSDGAFDSVAAHANAVLSELYVHMDRAPEAVALLEAQLPHVLEHGGLRLHGTYALALAKAHAAADSDRTVHWLHEAAAVAQAREDLYLEREASYLLAVTQAGDAQDAASRRFLVVDEEIRAAQTRAVHGQLHPLSSAADLRNLIAELERSPKPVRG